MLGISIYSEKVSDHKEIYNYIDTAYNLGVRKLFTCLLSVDRYDQEEIIKNFSFVQYAKELGMETIVDISPRVLNELNISMNDTSFFKKLGVTAVRLDEGFNGKKEADLTYEVEDLKVEINMGYDNSLLDLIQDFLPKKGVLQGSHNFYPQRYTGLSLDHFLKTTTKFKSYGLNTIAFIGVEEAKDGPWPLNDNAVTLEMHRDLSVETQVKHYYAMGNIDDLIISTQFASAETIKKIISVDENILEFKINLNENSDLENKIIFEEEHFRRGDSNPYSARSTQSRVKYKSFEFPSHDTLSIIKKGSVVIGNNYFGQYKGELQIILEDIIDEKQSRNIVGTIDESELFLLNYLIPNKRFKFTK